MNIEFDESEINRRLQARAAKKAGVPLKALATEEKEDDNSPIEHFLTPKLHALIAMRNHVWLPGPAGSGKSKAIELAATKLGLTYYCPPIGRETTSSQLMGYFNASGSYVRTPLREALEHGGLVHFEEFDFASPAVGTSTNSVLANDYVGFPDTVVKKHPDFILCASANTYGTGANATYIGSQGLNAATLDRFVFLEWPYDEKMEKRIAPSLPWCHHVQSMRKRVAVLGLKHIISPRATINGGKMVRSKVFAWEEIEKMILFRGLDQITIDKIKSTPTPTF